MCRDIFESIWKILYFTDPCLEDPDNSLKKLGGYLENLGNSFRYNCIQDQNYSVDEYLHSYFNLIYWDQNEILRGLVTRC